MQQMAKGILKSCSTEDSKKRCTIMTIKNADEPIVKDELPKALRAMWAEKTPEARALVDSHTAFLKQLGLIKE